MIHVVGWFKGWACWFWVFKYCCIVVICEVLLWCGWCCFDFVAEGFVVILCGRLCLLGSILNC